MDPVSAGIGVASLASGKAANKKAQGKADAAGKRGRSLDARLVKLFDVLFSRADNAVKTGQFDADKRIASLERDTGRYEAKDLGNLGGALADAGYRPGDSEIGTRLDAVKGKYRSFLDTMRDQIRSNQFNEEQNAYLSANPALLSGPTNNAYGQQGMNQGMVQGPGNFLQSFLPTLRRRPGGGGGYGFNMGSNNAASGGYGQTAAGLSPRRRR